MFHTFWIKIENFDHSGRTNERKVLKRQTARRNTGLALRQNSNCPLMKYVHWLLLSSLASIAAATIPFPTSYARAVTKVTYYLLTYSHGEVPNFWLDQNSFYGVSSFSKILI